MCTGIEIAALAAAAASTAVGTYGAIQQAEAQSQAAENQAKAQQYNAQIADRNAKIAEANAQSASQFANVKEESQRRRFAQLEGAAMAGVAQSGTGFGGTNMAIIEQNAIENELDALTIRYEGQQQAKGLEVTAGNYRSQAELDRMNASQLNANASAIRTGGYLTAGSMLLSAPSKAYANKQAFSSFG